MRKSAAILTIVALVIWGVVLVRMVLQPRTGIEAYILIPLLAFAGALAIYTHFLAGPWLSSLTWLLNGIMAVACLFTVAFQWRYFIANQPLRFAVMLVVLAAAMLNSIVLYPRAPRKRALPSG